MLVNLLCLIFLFPTRSIGTDEVQDYYWREYVPGDIPSDALEGAPGMYVGQVYHLGYTVPAGIYPHSYTAIGDFSGKIAYKENIKILCAPDLKKFYWENMSFKDSKGDEMKNAVKGGFHPGVGDYYIGRAFHENQWKIGRVFHFDHASKGCYIWDKNSKELKLTDFHMLKYMTRCV